MVFVIVQHSAGADDYTFAKGLEFIETQDEKLIGKVVKLGGITFATYDEARAYEEAEPYRDGGTGTGGIIANAPGTFHPTLKVAGLPIYIPKRDA